MPWQPEEANLDLARMLIFRSARCGRCRARQLRVHGSGAAHDTTRWGCEPHTLGPILQRQGFYTTGCWARTRHSRISMLESSFRCGGSPPALHLEERRVVSNLGVGELRSELPRGGGGGSSRGAGLSTNSTAPQLHSSTAPQLHLPYFRLPPPWQSQKASASSQQHQLATSNQLCRLAQ